MCVSKTIFHHISNKPYILLSFESSILIFNVQLNIAQSDEAVEYTDCFFAER